MTPLSDVRLAFRSLARRPAFSLLAVGILALGIGANAALFSVVDAVLLQGLPVADPDRLMVLFADGTARGQAPRLATTAGDFVDWREQADVFSGLAALRNQSFRITSVEAPVVPLVHTVSANYFDVLGARPLHGRTFQKGEDEPGRDRVVILSFGLWKTVFGGDPSIVGRSIDLDERPYTVVGVMGPDFHTAHFIAVQPGLWVPEPFRARREDRTTRDVLVFGRLAPGQTVNSGRAALASISARLAREHPDTNDRWGVSVVPLREHTVGPVSQTFGILLAAVGLVLLIACANVANLTLCRTAERGREIALRTALGASRGRILGLLLCESLVLAVLGGGLGLLLAWLGARPLAALIPEQAGVPFLDRVGVSWGVVGFTLLLSLLAAVMAGLAPWRQTTRLDLVTSLRSAGRGTVSAPGRRLREALIVAEVGLAVVVASGAALMLRSFEGLQQVAPGFDAERVLKLRVGLRGEEFQSEASRVAFFEELERRLRAIPGIASASSVSFEPPILAGLFGTVRISLPGVSEDPAAAPSAVLRRVTPDYFATLGIPLRQGRALTAADGPDAQRVVVISEAMARRYFPGVDPLGRTFSVHGPGSRPLSVVGVVGDVMTAGTDPSPQPIFYLPHAQDPIPIMSVVMRVPQGDPMALARQAEATAWSMTRNHNVYAVETLAHRIADLNWRPRFGALLLGAFAALALLLGAAGIYAVISDSVVQRQAEIGVRMAMGAHSLDVLRLVLGGGLRLALLGVAAGALTFLGVSRALAGLLYGVTPGDPATLAAVSGLLLAVAAVACLAPALRASRIDPVQALRD
jgi:putative ABC transport system permease protein